MSQEQQQENKQKIRIGLIFGGRSGEHEVSLASANSVMANLDKDKYEVILIGITKTGAWLLGTDPTRLLASPDAQPNSAQSDQQATTAVTLTGDPNVRRLIPLQNGTQLHDNGALDVIFPVMHGTYGEDGALQGLLEMANVPYVGCGVLGSALGMDKEKMKMLFQAIHLPVLPFLAYHRKQWKQAPETILLAVEQELGYPCIVKPANMGSSIGVSKAADRQTLEQAIAQAGEYDTKIIIERWLDVRELSCAVLGNEEPKTSLIGELVTEMTLLDYDAKYLHPGFHFDVPATIPGPLAKEVFHMSTQAFLVLDLSGLARVDFFLDRNDGRIYINEVNTMPDFTQDSVYPKLWSASNLPYPKLLDRLIELALERHQDRQRMRTRR
ncbi:D-alanine--D-alanine ligase family protein [Ktedonobacter racemifer]|uniref:D-alanine--D-alanine ligase n=1 Tax=Ktedonobacter racemifer DSM 44963 TaxID=485913 RepID=D6TBH6_KTERA|nr:D-alanine--D-alanine ligase family protein [Ktedonobacter racemifer]EFH87960.1 D-alanine/D-alanine ligase [Ktedonobacter racemifer DSM 44963]